MTFDAGHGDEAADVPAEYRMELLTYVALLYRNREAMGEMEAARRAAWEAWRGHSTGWMY